MNRKKGEAAWMLEAELAEIQVTLQKARQMCDSLSRYFDTRDKEEAAKAISINYNSMSLFPAILFDYILKAQAIVDDVVDLQTLRRMPTETVLIDPDIRPLCDR
ncbi:hypothetical protein LJC64_02835 [Ruminococcaceae bacterium OttesenSCG-928-A11]|nr:hypothetical protein [Ruminococcaceae bacterium OttesenSCG-928-A11]